MEKIFDKLSLYDFLGYIIPGILGMWSLSVLFNDILAVEFISFDNQGFINSVLFLGMSYYIGVLLHELSEWLQEHIYKKIWKGMPSERFFTEDDPKYSTEFKIKLREMIKGRFNLSLNNTPKINQEAFNLIYSEVQSLTKDDRIKTFNALYGMYRNFIAGTLLSLVICLIQGIAITIKADFTQAISNYTYALIFLIALLILSRRLRRFGERFVDYVIRDFYNSYSTKFSEKPGGNNDKSTT